MGWFVTWGYFLSNQRTACQVGGPRNRLAKGILGIEGQGKSIGRRKKDWRRELLGRAAKQVAAPTAVAAGTGWKQAGTLQWVLAVAGLGALQDTAWGWQWKARRLPHRCELALGFSLSSLHPQAGSCLGSEQSFCLSPGALVTQGVARGATCPAPQGRQTSLRLIWADLGSLTHS